MPCICDFDGIMIYMYYNDHMPPHFHAFYGEYEAIILISTLTVDRGEFPITKLKLVHKWAKLRKKELMENWELARQKVALNPIAPLE
ncbi:MAG TPA: DUF4160 domain-containing protein [Ktedonobacteraceae bacterium]|nr:DUF4160 domain-containing protein [Ktedonobacteraceae bacterium]